MGSQPETPKAQAEVSNPAKDDTFRRTVAAFGRIVERLAPWLLDLGSWIFGGLIAFNLVILGALLTVGPVDQAVLVATAAFALALPTDVAGFFLLRLAADMKNVALEDVATQAFLDAGFDVEQRPDAAISPEIVERRRTRVVLRYTYGMLAASVLLTLIGISGALWHMAWWIGVIFVGMVVVSLLPVLLAVVSTGSDTILRSPYGQVEPGSSASARIKR